MPELSGGHSLSPETKLDVITEQHEAQHWILHLIQPLMQRFRYMKPGA